MAFSNLIALSIIVTAAATLHAAGKTDIQTSAQAAEALRPIAGRVCRGDLCARHRRHRPAGDSGAAPARRPTPSARDARWPVGLARKPNEAVAFYPVLALSARHRHRAQLHPDQSDLGAVLERRRQRRARRACHGAADADGEAQRRHGPLRRSAGALYWLGWLSTAAMAAERRRDGDRILC